MTDLSRRTKVDIAQAVQAGELTKEAAGLILIERALRKLHSGARKAKREAVPDASSEDSPQQ